MNFWFVARLCKTDVSSHLLFMFISVLLDVCNVLITMFIDSISQCFGAVH